MNATTAARGRHAGWLIGGLLVLLAAGCATHKIDWAARIGNYSYDQAVLDFGPPDKQAKLQDGVVVAEWLTRRGYVYSAPGYYPYWYGGPWYPPYVDSAPNYYLRLTFGPDSRLKDWKKFSR